MSGQQRCCKDEGVQLVLEDQNSTRLLAQQVGRRQASCPWSKRNSAFSCHTAYWPLSGTLHEKVPVKLLYMDFRKHEIEL